ncbi:MAG: aldo/keto reductase [Oscillospiraceae bacterium]|nr:aldo/keto reductase [Oscillospiraceae bacterium]
MQYRLDKKSNTELSVFGLGGMRLSKDFDVCRQMIVDAHEAGVNYIDTAYVYGGSEEMLGKCLEDTGLREKFHLATKLPIWMVKNPTDFDKFFSRSISRLRTNYIDYYLLHNLSSPNEVTKLCELGLEDWITQKRESGEIRRLGFSFHGAQKNFLDILEMRDWDFVLLQYNYSDPNYQAGITGIRAAAAKGIPVIIMEPLLGGRLANALPKAAQELFRKENPNRSFASWGLRWLYDQPEITLCISGMGKREFWLDNIATAKESHVGMLTDEERNVYVQVRKILREKAKSDCTGCGYCMPCPKGVNIPGCLAAYNARYMNSYKSAFQQYFTNSSFVSEKSTAASLCTGCRACERHCPQNIKIADELKEVRRVVEPFWWSFAHRVFHSKKTKKFLEFFYKHKGI